MPVSISVPTLLIALAIFLITVYLMERLVFTPVRAAWAERDRSIQEGLEASNRGREEAQRAREEGERILADARREAQGEIDEATTSGGRTRDQLVAKATDEFRRLLDEARGEIAQERERSAAALRGHIIDIALMAASRVTGQTFNQPSVRELAATVVEREGLR